MVFQFFVRFIVSVIFLLGAFHSVALFGFLRLMALYVIAVVCSIARYFARFIASCLYIVVIFCFVCLLRFLAPTHALCFIAF